MNQRYALIQDNIIKNIIMADKDFLDSLTEYECIHLLDESTIDIGFQREGEVWKKPEAPLEELSNKIRSVRNRLITETDYLIMPDYPIDNKQKWIEYRQALRDIPQQDGFPHNIVWPDKPEIVLEEEQ